MGLFGIETGAESDFGDSLRRQASGQGPSVAQSMLNANTAQVQRNMAGMAQQRSGVNSALAYRNAMTAGGDLAAQNAQTAATARAQEQMNAQGLYGQWLQQQSKNANAGMGALLGGAGAMGGMFAGNEGVGTQLGGAAALLSDERAKTQVAPGGNAADEFMTAALQARDQRARLMPAMPQVTPGSYVMHGGPRDVTGLPMQPPSVDTRPVAGALQTAATGAGGALEGMLSPNARAYHAGLLAAQQARQAPGNVVAEQARLAVPQYRPATAADLAGAVPLEQAAAPHTYQYKDQARFGGGENLGVMAQDMQHVAPGMVQQGPDGLLHVDTGRLAGATAAATGRLHDRLSQVEQMLGVRMAGQAAPNPGVAPTGAARGAVAGRPAAVQTSADAYDAATNGYTTPPGAPPAPPRYDVTVGPAVMETPQFGRSLRHGPMRYRGAR